ncbi:hypothetical protein V474_07890 [Novosphingobium barchaimii LL02]|uniref:Uncharacterized protein n=1 Tax=Novosphingobium barchaimii LL02 TaxID=1114963 RepID=A0A0J7Y9L5_9SPHN|nr:hypothetical protein [Novosphingobium barchaimii]KMS59998.1 hypothetical protein V474_07890 [Novosphingobium barchaimii LL02]
MSLTKQEKLNMRLCVWHLAQASRQNSMAMRYLALHQLYSDDDRGEDAAKALDDFRDSLEKSDVEVSAAQDAITTALGLEE